MNRPLRKSRAQAGQFLAAQTPRAVMHPRSVPASVTQIALNASRSLNRSMDRAISSLGLSRRRLRKSTMLLSEANLRTADERSYFSGADMRILISTDHRARSSFDPFLTVPRTHRVRTHLPLKCHFPGRRNFHRVIRKGLSLLRITNRRILTWHSFVLSKGSGTSA